MTFGKIYFLFLIFHLFENDKVVDLAPNYAPSTTYTHEQIDGLMIITKSCIRRVTSFCLSFESKPKLQLS
jgi:hypothetical protein